MEHYVTLFDSLFLPQGLALHASLQRHAGAHMLWVLCMDEAARQALERLALPNLRTIPLAEAETDALRAVKPGRSPGEYCWTLTPFTPRLVFDRAPDARRVTYLDADTWLCRDPAELFAEFDASGKAVQITEHGYAADHEKATGPGRFCVQFITFVRDRGEGVRRWWEERCVEWCFARYEDGRFGDQKYLDDWPTRFAAEVHVLQRLQLTQAPWNCTRFPAGEAVLYHFHGLRLLDGGRVQLTVGYTLPPATRTDLYAPYLADLRDAVARLRAAGVTIRPQARPIPMLRLRRVFWRARRWVRGLLASPYASL